MVCGVIYSHWRRDLSTFRTWDTNSLRLIYATLTGIKSSVADPDSVGSGLFGSPGSGSGSGKIPQKILYPQKDPCNLTIFVKYHCLKHSFVQIIFIFHFKCHKMIRFGKKMPKKNIYFAKHLKHI